MNALIFQCPTCRALVGATGAELAPDRAGLRCEACGAVTWLPQSGGRSEARVVDVEPSVRPPTPRELPPPGGAMVVAATAMPAPNVIDSHFSAEVRARLRDRFTTLPPPTESQLGLAEAFDELLGNWQGEGVHKALLKRASSEGELAFVGQRYRALLDVVPQDAAARRAQSEILSLAMATMAATRDLGGVGTDPAAKAKRRTLVASLILFAFAAIILWAVRERNGLLRDRADGAKMEALDPAGPLAR